MQNNENRRNGAFAKFFQEKGYYIVLFLCVAAVGISGYIFVSGAISEKEELNGETLSTAAKAEIPESVRKSAEVRRQSPAIAAKDPPEETVTQTVALTGDDAVREAAESIRIWPVSGSTQFDYSMEKLAFNPTTQDWRTHDGMDLCASAGEPVMAAAKGTVTAVFDDEFLGTTVSVTHDGGWVSSYANLTAMPTVKVGQQVAAGDVIGAVGSTALLETAQEPHLHFSVARDGVSQDPMTFLD